MRKLFSRVRSVLSWIWVRAAAGVAVLLILIAFMIGQRAGRGPEASSVEVAENHENHEDAENSDEPVQMYTCSMHPTVRLSDPNAKCPICFMDLIPVVSGGADLGPNRISVSESAAVLSRFETAAVVRFFPTAEVRLYGKLGYDETSVARLTAYFPGRIERLFVNYLGVPVAQGDHMAEVYSPDLLAAYEELRQSAQAAERTGGSSEIVRSATRSTLVAAREKLRLLGVHAEMIAAVEDGSYSADWETIYAPIGGVVTHLAVREGDYVKTGDAIATVADLSRLWLDMEAFESHLPLLRWGQRVEFTVEAHPGETFEGRISFIEPMIDERTRTAAVRVTVDNSDDRLKPGMFASAIVRTRVGNSGAVIGDELAGRWVGPMHPTVVKDGPGECDICGMDLVPAESLGVVADPGLAVEPMVIPRTAVLFTGTRSVVYVSVPDTEAPTYESRSVLLGSRAGDFYIVRAGLELGERVVIAGAFRVDSAMQIAAKSSMMMPSPGADGGDDETGSAPEGFLTSLEGVYAGYFAGQEALAADDLDGFTRAAKAIDDAVGAVDIRGLVGEPLSDWRRIKKNLSGAQNASDLDSARVSFELMSEGVVSLLRRFGNRDDDPVNLAHCPMAFENAGANWLQRGTDIRNPYFGSMMLGCGDIRETFVLENEANKRPVQGGHQHD